MPAGMPAILAPAAPPPATILSPETLRNSQGYGQASPPQQQQPQVPFGQARQGVYGQRAASPPPLPTPAAPQEILPNAERHEDKNYRSVLQQKTHREQKESPQRE